MAVTYKNPSLAFYIEDDDKGVPTFSNAAAGLKLQFLRLVSEDLNTQFSREESNEIRGDAQSSGSVITSASGAGSVSIQYSLDTYDEMLAGVLFSDYATSATRTTGRTGRDWGWSDLTGGGAVTTSQSGDWSVSGDVLTLTGGSVTLSDDDIILIAGSGEQNLDGVWRVDGAVSASATITLHNDTGEADIETYLDTASGSATLTITKPEQLCRNGTNDVTFGFVRCYTDTSKAGTAAASSTELTDGSQDWAQFRGVYLTSLQLSVAPGQAGWTGTFSTLFSDELVVTTPSTTIVDDWDKTAAANANPLPDAINGVAQITVRNKTSGAVKRHDALSMNVNVSNNSEEVQALRNRGALCINQGTLSATLDMEIIYEGSVFHTAMLDDDLFEIEFVVKDSDGKAQLWRFPACRMTSERPNPGKNQPIVQTLSFTAEAGGTPFGSAYLVDADVSTTKMVEVARFYDAEAFADLS